MTPTDSVPITQVLQKQDKELVMRVEGRVAWVNDPMDQNAGDIEYDRHKQNIRIADEAGNSLTIQIQKANMHFPKEAKGKHYVFESQQSANHGWKGLTIDRWTRTKGDKAGEDMVTLVASKMANIFSPDAPASPPASQGQPDPSQAGSQATPPAQTSPPSGAGAGGTGGGMSLADARAAAERKAQAAPDTVEGNAEEWIRVYKAVEPMAKAAGVQTDHIPALTTHVRLQFCMSGGRCVFRGEQSPAQTPASQGTQEAPKPTWRDQPCGGGKTVGSLSREEFIDLLLRSYPYSGDAPGGKAIKAAVIEGMPEIPVTFEQAYDTLSARLYTKYGRNAVDEAYDELKEMMSIPDDEGFCAAIIAEQDQFEKTVQTKAEPAAAQNPPVPSGGDEEVVGAPPLDDDDIPF